MTKVHHTAILTGDVDESLRFWRDGLGFEVQIDHTFTGDWPVLFGAGSDDLRAVFLGHPGDLDSGIIELVELPEPLEAAIPSPALRTGFFLVSVFVDVDAVLGRLAHLGLGGEPRIIVHETGIRMATVRDPNDVLVELVGTGAADNLERIGRTDRT